MSYVAKCIFQDDNFSVISLRSNLIAKAFCSTSLAGSCCLLKLLNSPLIIEKSVRSGSKVNAILYIVYIILRKGSSNLSSIFCDDFYRGDVVRLAYQQYIAETLRFGNCKQLL